MLERAWGFESLRPHVITALAAIVLSAALASPKAGPYFDAPFKVRGNSHAFGQAPTWARNGDVLSKDGLGA